MHWKVEPHEVMPTKEVRGRFGSKQSLARSKFSIDSMGCEDNGKQVYVKTVHYKGNVVARKDISMMSIPVNRALLMELRYLKDLHHNHLARFVGACIDTGDNAK